MNNLFRYKIGEVILISPNHDLNTLLEVTMTGKVVGAGKSPSVVKVHSTTALHAFAERGVSEASPRKDAWLNTKEWHVKAVVGRNP